MAKKMKLQELTLSEGPVLLIQQFTNKAELDSVMKQITQLAEKKGLVSKEVTSIDDSAKEEIEKMLAKQKKSPKKDASKSVALSDLSAIKSKKPKEQRKKRPRSAYVLWKMDTHDAFISKLKELGMDTSPQEVMKAQGKKWTAIHQKAEKGDVDSLAILKKYAKKHTDEQKAYKTDDVASDSGSSVSKHIQKSKEKWYIKYCKDHPKVTQAVSVTQAVHHSRFKLPNMASPWRS